MKINFKVAVIMCIYCNDNVEQFIEAFESIKLKQHGIASDNINVYLHIDGQIGEELVKAISSLNLYKTIHSSQNVGLAEGLNKLLSAIGDEKYIFRMDADDISDNIRLNRQMQYMEQNPKLDFCGGGMAEFVGEKSNIVATRSYPNNLDDINRFMEKGSPFSHVTVCFRGTSLNKIGLYPTSYPLNEDIALWNQAAENGCCYSNIDDVVCFVRMDSTYSRRTITKAKYELQVYLLICKRLGKFPIYPLARFAFRLLPSSIVKVIYNSFVRHLLLR